MNELGRTGEAVAAKYYQKQGWLLLDHNYRTRLGEIDLILCRDNTLVFAEVKTRRDDRFSAPAEAVTYSKQRRIVKTAALYLQQSPFKDHTIRFDVVEVLPAEGGWRVHCIKNAFEAD